jgi:nitroimidazol reductase NimA-like FMN-containing flavoprotein (pyridoxamine 5'-phosphate oxidase superfamily)
MAPLVITLHSELQLAVGPKPRTFQFPIQYPQQGRSLQAAPTRQFHGRQRRKVSGMTDAPLDRPPTSANVRALPESECYDLLAVAVVGRIGFVSADGVQIIPVNFRLGPGHRIFLKTSPGGTVAKLARVEASVAFEVDHHSAGSGVAWSVLMNGTLSFLDDEASAAYAELRMPPSPWPGLTDTVSLQFVPRTISGRGLHRP